MYKIVLIGAGQLGGRHLQSLAKMDIPILIDVVDLGLEQLNLAKERFEQIPEHVKIHSVNYRSSLKEAFLDIDVCIIATTADVRCAITKEVLNTKKVKNIIFEKVLFQSLNDYDEVEQLLGDKGVKAWVNCPRRMYPFYHEVKEYFQEGERISYHLNGGNWGLACNSIHFVDHMAFYSGMNDFEIDTTGLYDKIYESKRKGFVEFFGTLKLNYNNGSELVLHSHMDSSAPSVLSILGEKCHVVACEASGKAFISSEINAWKWEENNIIIPFQSELTHLAVAEILSKGHCCLTKYSDSAKLHKPLIKGLLKHIELICNRKIDNCPIT